MNVLKNAHFPVSGEETINFIDSTEKAVRWPWVEIETDSEVTVKLSEDTPDENAWIVKSHAVIPCGASTIYISGSANVQIVGLSAPLESSFKTNGKGGVTKADLDKITPQLLFSGVTSADSPAVVDLSGYEMILITAAYTGATKYITSEYITTSEIEDYISNQNRVVSSVSNSTSISFYFSGSLGNCGIYSDYPLRIYGINQHTELKIYSQPEDVTCTVGETAVFSVGVQGDGLTYQWYGRVNKDRDFAIIGGRTTSSISFSFASYDWNGYQYRCIITDKYGDTVTSDAATLTVTESFNIDDTVNEELGG